MIWPIRHHDPEPKPPVYVDELMDCIRSSKWPYSKACHLFVDTRTDLDVLHAFAQSLGLKRSWFQNNRNLPHYDLTASKREQAVDKGAIEVDRRSAGMVFRRWRELKQQAKDMAK